MTISKELLDELLKGCERPEDLLGDAGLMERMLGAELTAHPGYEDDKDAPAGQANRRNGTSSKRLKGQDGEVPIAVPRDRDGSFEPELVKKGQTRIDGIDDKIVGLCAAGLTVRDIRAHLEDVYGLQVSPDLISRVTDAVLDEVRDWQSRALDRMYPVVIFDALRVKIRDADSRMVRNKAVYVALGVTRDGVREVLGLWIADNEGAKFWLSVMNELKNRGGLDIPARSPAIFCCPRTVSGGQLSTPLVRRSMAPSAASGAGSSDREYNPLSPRLVAQHLQTESSPRACGQLHARLVSCRIDV